MRKIFLFVTAALISAVSFSQTQTIDAKNAEKRNVNSFHAIKSSAGIEVYITQSDKEELAVTASEKELISKIETVVEGGVLKINRKNDWDFWNHYKNYHVKVYVSFKTLNAIDVSSGSSLYGELKTDALDADVSSGGQIKISGSAKSLTVESSSGGQFASYDFAVDNCSAHASSGGEIRVTVNKEMSAKANSGGSIKYKGDGGIKNISVNSGGEVKRSSK